MSESPGAVYRRDIDGLRALAVCAVVIYHVSPSWLPAGYLGVDVFFVISGYLISGIILRGLASQTFDLGDFYHRRARRILPALLAVLGSCLALGWALLLAEEYELLARGSFFSLTFLQNFNLMQTTGYFDPRSDLNPLLHLWSLSIEEQFYLLYPVSLLLLLRRKRSTGLWVTAVFLLSFALDQLLRETHPTESFYATPARAWELLLGALIVMRGPSKDQTRAQLASITGLLLLLFTLTRSPEASVVGEYLPLLATFSAGVLLWSWPRSGIIAWLLSNRVAVCLGLISYPLYLWHWPLLSLGRVVEGKQFTPSVALIAVGLALLLAALTYQLLERRLRAGGPRTTWMLLGVAGVMAGHASMIWIADGVPSRHPQSEELADGGTNKSWRAKGYLSDDACAAKYAVGIREGEYCQLQDLHSLPTVALVGDSTSNHLYPGLSELYAKRGENVLHLGHNSCPTFTGVDTRLQRVQNQCSAAMEKIFDLALKTPSIKTIILSMAGQAYLSGLQDLIQGARIQLVPVDGGDEKEIFKTHLLAMIRRLILSGKEIIYVLGVPRFNFNPVSCVQPRPWKIFARNTRARCAMAKSVYVQDFQAYRSFMTTVSKDFPRLKLWDAGKEFCAEAQCSPLRDRHLMYRDDSHLSSAGSRAVARSFPY